MLSGLRTFEPVRYALKKQFMFLRLLTQRELPELSHGTGIFFTVGPLEKLVVLRADG
jgi:hypothetical protein